MKTREPAWGTEVLRLPTHLERRSEVTRPYPPASCADDEPETFEPDATFLTWIRETFIDGSGPLFNEEHEHLADAVIGVLWTNARNVSKLREVQATAEMPNAMAGGWKRARFEKQIRDWFGEVPDFVLTFSAQACLLLTDREFCALVEHELYHCAPKCDEYDTPLFNRANGRPMFTMRGHDFEEFNGVVERYGATSRELRSAIAAANRGPEIDGPTINIACGVCMKVAA